MSKKTDNSVTIKLESQVLSKVEELCNRIDNRLSIVRKSDFEDKIKNHLLVCQKYIELLGDSVDQILDALDDQDRYNRNDDKVYQLVKNHIENKK